MDGIAQRYRTLHGKTKYDALARAINAAIVDGALLPGDKLPPLRRLARTLGMTPGTAARAFAQLSESGVLITRVGAGTFVTDRHDPDDGAADPAAAGPAPRLVADKVDLTAVCLPDLGQVHWLRQRFGALASNDPDLYLRYPCQRDRVAAQEAACVWLANRPTGAVDPADILPVQGVQAGLATILQAFLQAGPPCILVEETVYPGMLRLARAIGAQIIAVPCDDDGAIPEAMAAVAETADVQLFFCGPDGSNPAARVMPQARREAIAALARRHDFHILEDDALCLAGALPTFRALAPERGWYLAGLSKTLSPALRLGVAVAPRPHRGTLARAAQDRSLGLAAPVDALAVALFGDPQTLQWQERIRSEMDTLVGHCIDALARFLPSWQAGVPWIWLPVPRGRGVSDLLLDAERCGLVLRPAEAFCPPDGLAQEAVRIAIDGRLTPESLRAAVSRLNVLVDRPQIELVP